MPITSDTMNEIFNATNNDMQEIVNAAKETFYSPEIDRATVQMWLNLPLVLKEAITERNPALAKSLDKKAENLRKGVDNGTKLE